MTGKLTRSAYEQLIAEDIAWLRTVPRTLERDHIIMVLEASPEHEYGPRAPDSDRAPPGSADKRAGVGEYFDEVVSSRGVSGAGVWTGGYPDPEDTEDQSRTK